MSWQPCSRPSQWMILRLSSASGPRAEAFRRTTSRSVSSAAPPNEPRATRRQPPNLQSRGTSPAPSRATRGAALHHSRSLQIPHHGWDDGYRAGSPSARVLGADIRHFRFAPTSFSEALDIASATCYAAKCWGGGSQLLAGVIDDAEVNDASRPSTAEPRLDGRPLNYAPVGS